jgi:HlyD family secretion protein
MKMRLLVLAVVLGILSGLGYGALWLVRATAPEKGPEIPTTRVRKGRVTITVAARGELQGGSSEMFTAPQAGGGDIIITYLRQPGELVHPGDVVAQFDTTQQEYNLQEAEADLAEAEQQVVKAQADADAAIEEARYQTLSTEADVKIAQLEVRKNPILAAIAARQNDIALQAAQNRKEQADRDFATRKATANTSVDIQRAIVQRAMISAQNAQRIIDSMTLRAKTTGYVNVQQNTNQNTLYVGAVLPTFQVGDTLRAGQAVAQIPDMNHWEVAASIPELDRGHLQQGQKVTIRAAALPEREFRGHVKSLGGTMGSSWDRRFDCRIALDESGPELRPGMTSNISITVESLDNVLWLPSQALFESDNRPFVYLRTDSGFVARDVSLVRRSESQAVIAGLDEGDLVALSNPEEQGKSANSGQSDGVMKALSK